MSSRGFAAAVSLAVCAVAGCAAQPAPPAEGVPRAAAAALERSRACAADLARVAEEDPAGVARALEVEPIRLAPHGGPAVAPVHAEIAERLESARADAAAAAMMARAGEEAAGHGAADRRAQRSLKVSADLCRSADLIRQERLARSR